MVLERSSQQAPKLSLLELRQLVKTVEEGSARECRPFSLFSSGMPRSAVVEIFGVRKTEFLVTFLLEVPDVKICWLERQLTLNPFALLQRGLDLSRITFVETADVGWAAQQILQSQIFEIVVFSDFKFEERELRKFQLMVEKYRGHVMLLSESAHSSWVPALQIQVEVDGVGRIRTHVHRKK